MLRRVGGMIGYYNNFYFCGLCYEVKFKQHAIIYIYIFKKRNASTVYGSYESPLKIKINPIFNQNPRFKPNPFTLQCLPSNN